jgi:hypothetical protein
MMLSTLHIFVVRSLCYVGFVLVDVKLAPRIEIRTTSRESRYSFYCNAPSQFSFTRIARLNSHTV